MSDSYGYEVCSDKQSSDHTIVVKHEPPKGERSRDLNEFAVNP
jgi:hypothetical protein